MGSLQRLFSASHKYQVLRLQQWCEQALSTCVSIDDVCPILCQAHLHEAKQLEKVCLAWIKANMAQVVALPAFSGLTRDWPQVMLKINLFLAGVPDSEASKIVNTHESYGVKRPTDGKETESGNTK